MDENLYSWLFYKKGKVNELFETLYYVITKIITDGPYECILGFSQGGRIVHFLWDLLSTK